MSLDIPIHLLPNTNRLRKREFATDHWFLTVGPSITLEQVMDPDFWVHLTGKLKVYDRVEVVAENGILDVDLRVVAVDKREPPTWAKMRVLRSDGPYPIHEPAAPVEEADEEFADGYAIKFRGYRRFAIQDRVGNWLEEDIPTKKAAIEKLAEIRREKLAA